MQRYKGIVGKSINGYVYLHKMYIGLLFPDLVDTVEFYENQMNWTFNLLKVKIDKSSISFVNCTEFDTVDEPTVGTVWRLDLTNGQIVMGEYNHYVYHHKWLWVQDDYDGFDVQESKLRSFKWLKLNLDKKKIGSKTYWQQILDKYNDFK